MSRAIFPVNTGGNLIAPWWEILCARIFGAVWDVTAEGFTTRFITWRGKMYVVSQTQEQASKKGNDQ